jgi:hypothetical protein
MKNFPTKDNNKSKGDISFVNKQEFLSKKNINTKISKPQQKEEIQNEDQQEENPNEFQRDESKWKYSKQELAERRKKLLKESRSHLKKAKN